MAESFNKKICILGLGYVGLPLALAFSKKYKTIGFDIDQNKINSLKKGNDIEGQFSKKQIINHKNLNFSYIPHDMDFSDFYIIAVPTPINNKNKPNLEYLYKACKLVGQRKFRNSTIIFESTVYPGLTEEICIPLIEKISKKKWKKDFFIGYSPERINPGDKIHKLESITKVISADSKTTLKKLKHLYNNIIDVGTYSARSIKVAEAAKIIENTQRDINIALMNELSLICNKLNISTYDVLKTARTKWNFIDFKPGLVGGHCIGVDPYYLSHKAKIMKHNPLIINAGRKINDNMHKVIQNKIIKILNNNFRKKITFIGITFKSDCADTRNSKIILLISNLIKNGFKNIDIYDPLVNNRDLSKNNGLKLKSFKDLSKSDFLIVGSYHKIIDQKIGKTKLIKLLKKGGNLFDINWHFYDYFESKKPSNINYYSL